MLQIKIGQHIDRYGFLGRENHPTSIDCGLTCRVLGVETLLFFAGDTEVDQKNQERWFHKGLMDAEAITPEILLQGKHVPEDFQALKGNTIDVYYCVTEDGRLLEIMEHEVEAVTLVRE
jgi:hypothetical protein